MADYNLTAGIHTISIKTHDTVTETVGVSYVSQNPQTNVTTVRINANKLSGFLVRYPDYLLALESILQRAGIHSYHLIRVDMCFDSFDAEHYQKYAKINRLLISMIAQTYHVQNKYRTTDLFTNNQLSVAIKNPNSFEVENYDKAAESLGNDICKSRFEIRSLRMNNQDIEEEFVHHWDMRFDKAMGCFDATLERYNTELLKRFYEEQRHGQKVKWATFFQKYENCIFTKGQAIDLLEGMGVGRPEERYKYFKKKYGLLTYTDADVRYAIFEIQRARDVFFGGAEKYPIQSDLELKIRPVNNVI